MALNTFIYQDQIYIRCVPAKSLFKSSMVHEVVNRGDIFAIRCSDQVLTIIPGTAKVEHTKHILMISHESTINKTPATRAPSEAEKRSFRKLAAEIRKDIEQRKQRTLFGNL